MYHISPFVKRKGKNKSGLFCSQKSRKKIFLKKGLTNGASRRKIITNFKLRNRGARKVSKDGCIREPLAGVNAAAQNLPNGLARAA